MLIKKYCEELGIPQAELANITGMDQTTVARYSRGQNPSLRNLKILAWGLGVTVDELIADEDISDVTEQGEKRRLEILKKRNEDRIKKEDFRRKK